MINVMWEAAPFGSVTLSNNNLTVQGNTLFVKTNVPAPNKKSYYEFKIITNGNFEFGLVGTSFVPAAGYIQYGTGVFRTYISWTGSKGFGTSSSDRTSLPYSVVLVANDVLGIYIDKVNNTVGFTVNGIDKGIAFSDLNLIGSDIYPAVSIDGSNAKFSANFGGTSFEYAPPSGYTSYQESTVVGDASISAEKGWRRFVPQDTRFAMTNFVNASTFYYCAVNGSTIKFKFYGTKMRFISSYDTRNGYSIDVKIDNTTENFSCNKASKISVLAYEKIGLTLGIHDVTITIVDRGTNEFDFYAVDIDENGYLGSKVELDSYYKGSSVTLSNNNLTASIGAGTTAKSSIGKRTGKWYCEMTNFIGTRVTCGIGNSLVDLETDFIERDNGFGYYSYNGSIWRGGVQTLSGVTFSGLDVLGIAMDLDNHTVAFYVNGILQATPYTSLPDDIYYIMMSSAASTAGGDVNFGANLFKYPIPNGFSTLEPNTIYLRVKTNLSKMKVGDYISCSYTAPVSGKVGVFSELGNCNAAEIPVISSATPNGKFYWIHSGYDYKGRLKLIADRNIQHSISWDALNTAGIASGSGVPYYFDCVPVLNGSLNNSLVGITINGGDMGSYERWKLFDKSIDVNGYHSNGDANYYEIKFDYNNNPKNIVSYIVSDRVNSSSHSPKNWLFQFSDDGSNWTTIHTAVNQINWVSAEKRKFLVNSNGNHRYYRMYVTASASNANPTNFYLSFGELQLFEELKFSASIRLLTGGTSATDLVDNEWNRIIVNSTLNGTITAGDDNVWHWKNIYSWTSSTYSLGNNYRNISGYSSASYNYGSITSTSNSSTGFRPMLLVELPSTSYLIRSGTKIKYTTDGVVLLEVDKPVLSIDDFSAYGITDLSLLTETIFNALPDNFKILKRE